jgi:replicative DNA helicase
MIELSLLNGIVAKKDYGVLIRYGIDHEKYFYEQKCAYQYLKKHLKEYGELPSIESMAMNCPEFEVVEVAESLDTLAKKLIERHIKREQKSLLTDIAEHFGSWDAYRILDKLQTKLEEWQGQAYVRTAKGVNWAESGEQRFQEYLNRKRKDFGKKIPLFLDEYSEATGGGAERGEMIVIMAFTGVGKSWLGCLQALKANQAGFRVLYESVETSDLEIQFRLDTLEGGFNNAGLWTGQLGFDEEKYRKFTEKFNRGTSRPPLIIKTPLDWPDGLTLEQLEYDIRQTNADLVVIDQFNLMRFKGHSREDKVAFSRQLKQLAAKLGVVLIVLHQANAEYEKSKSGDSEGGIRELKPPTRTDYSETISIIQDANKLFGLDAVTWKDPETGRRRGKAVVLCDKDRSGGAMGMELELVWMPNDGVITTRQPTDIF